MGCSGFANILLQDLNLFEVVPFFAEESPTGRPWRSGGSPYRSPKSCQISCTNVGMEPMSRAWTSQRAEMTLNISKKELNRSLTRAEIQGFDGKTLKSYVKAAILINMNTPTGLADVVKLTVKCFPGYHMNYNVNMSNAKDLSFVGGELGGSSGPKESQAFLQVGQGTIQMRSDSGFQYHQRWEELGGSASAALYLHQDDSVAEGFNLMTTPCTKADQQKATEICRKAGLKNEASLSFAECVFDVCRAGGDALPELTELSWLQDD